MQYKENKTKIAFYVSHYPSEDLAQYPLNVGYLAAMAHERLKVPLNNMIFARTLAEIAAFKPDILAVSSVSQVFDDALYVASESKKRTGCLTVLGGYHISALPQSLPEAFDLGVIGEGEETFQQIVDRFSAHTHGTHPDFSAIEGICYHSSGAVVCTPPKTPVRNIDAFPHPLRDGDFREGAYVFTSRGCPYRCIFCASCKFWGSVRYHSAEYVLDEFRALIRDHRVRTINILDDIFIADRKRFFSIVEGVLKEGIHKSVAFHGFVRANLVDEDIVMALKAMNFSSIRFGAETGSNRVLRYLKKGSVTTDQNQKLIDLCHIHGLPVGASFVFGTPGETEADINETRAFLERNRGLLEIMGFYLLQAVPGTELWHWAQEKGLVSESIDWSALGLDLQKPEFNWDDARYLNNGTLPLGQFRTMVEEIRSTYLLPARGKAFHRLREKYYQYYPYRSAGKPIRLEVGSGGAPRAGFIHCDVVDGQDVEYICQAFELPFKENSVDEVYARHVIEHLTLEEARRTFRHWFRILREGGYIDINVPDFERHLEQLTTPGLSPYADSDISNAEHAMAGFYGWQRNGFDIHKWGYTFESLRELLADTGFTSIRRIPDTSRSGPLNLRVVAYKEAPSAAAGAGLYSPGPRWTYFNWKGIFRAALRKARSSAKRATKLPHRARTLIDKDYGDGGERQASRHLNGIRADHRGRYVFAASSIKPGDAVLDCACGVGYGSAILSRRSDPSKIIAIDRSKKAISYANKFYADKKIEYQCGDAFAVGLPDNNFDCIVSLETLEHVDGSRLVHLFREKLKVGGRLIVSTPNEEKQPFNKRDFPSHLRHYTPHELDALLNTAGFIVTARLTQHHRDREDVTEGWDGLFNIAVAEKLPVGGPRQ